MKLWSRKWMCFNRGPPIAWTIPGDVKKVWPGSPVGSWESLSTQHLHPTVGVVSARSVFWESLFCIQHPTKCNIKKKLVHTPSKSIFNLQIFFSKASSPAPSPGITIFPFSPGHDVALGLAVWCAADSAAFPGLVLRGFSRLPMVSMVRLAPNTPDRGSKGIKRIRSRGQMTHLHPFTIFTPLLALICLF